MKKTNLRSGINYIDGKLFISFSDFFVVLEAWPHLKAWRLVDNKWKRITPYIDISENSVEFLGIKRNNLPIYINECLYNESPYSSARKKPRRIVKDSSSRFGYMPGDTIKFNSVPWKEKNFNQISRCIKQFFSNIPPDIRDVVSRVKSNQWKVLRWARDYKEYADLLVSNPALAFCVCSAAKFTRIGRVGKSHYRELLKQKQRKIAAYLGFPDTEQTVKILKRIDPELLNTGEMRGIREIIAEHDAARKLLSHTKIINAAVIDLVVLVNHSPAVYSSMNTSFLNEIASTFPVGKDIFSPTMETADQLGDFMRYKFMLSDLDRYHHITNLRSIQDLINKHQELVGSQNSKMVESDVSFPDPPVPGNKNIRYIASAGELGKEASRQKNCVSAYARDILMENVFVYKVFKPQRATLSIRRKKRKWAIDQLECANNQNASPATYENVKKWLG